MTDPLTLITVALLQYSFFLSDDYVKLRVTVWENGFLYFMF